MGFPRQEYWSGLPFSFPEDLSGGPRDWTQVSCIASIFFTIGATREAPKYSRTVVLEKTLKSSLDCKKIQPVHSEGDQPWDFFGGNDAKAETPVLWPPHEKSWLFGKDSDVGRDWVQEEKGTTEDEMAGWHHWLDGRESEWTLRAGDGQGGLVCCDSWGRKESDTTEWLNWTELKSKYCVCAMSYESN